MAKVDIGLVVISGIVYCVVMAIVIICYLFPPFMLMVPIAIPLFAARA
jgi:hypothetical protein